jgi:hypothetical protein
MISNITLITGTLLVLMLSPLITVTLSLVLGVMLAIASFHAYLMSWLILLRLNKPGATSHGEVKKIERSMMLLFMLLGGGVGALGVALKQVSIILTGQ